MSDEQLTTESQSHILTVEYPGDEAFIEAFDERLSSLIAPTAPAHVRPGEKVALSIRVKGHPGRVVVRGTVSPFRPSDGRGLVIKIRLEDAGRLRKAAALLKAGPDVPVREERLQTDDFPVEYVHDGHTQKASVRDVATGGCFLATRAPMPPVGAAITLESRPPGSLFFKLRLKARVTWVDEVEESRGFGVRFDSDQGQQVERFLFTVLVAD